MNGLRRSSWVEWPRWWSPHNGVWRRHFRALSRGRRLGAVTEAPRGAETLRELESGYSVTIAGKAVRKVLQAASASKRAWAACLRKIFEVDPVRCVKCGGVMKLVAVILDDRELDRILAHQGWPMEFPKTKASRAPPGSVERGDESGQEDPRGDWDGRQDFPSEWPA